MKVLRLLDRISLLSDLAPVMKLICLTFQPVPELLSVFGHFSLLFPPYPRSFRHSSSRFACFVPSATCSRALFDVSWGAWSYRALWRTLGILCVFCSHSAFCVTFTRVFLLPLQLSVVQSSRPYNLKKFFLALADVVVCGGGPTGLEWKFLGCRRPRWI